jgi:hypothetical protein
MGDRKGVYRVLVGRPVGKSPLGIPRGVDWRIIVRWGSVDWVDLAEDRDRWRTLVNEVMNLVAS